MDHRNINLLNNLPYDILLHIFSFLDTQDIANVSRTSKKYVALSVPGLANGPGISLDQAQAFWRHKFADEYPLVYARMSKPLHTNWYGEFKARYLLAQRLADRFPMKYEEILRDLGNARINEQKLSQMKPNEFVNLIFRAEYLTGLPVLPYTPETLRPLYKTVTATLWSSNIDDKLLWAAIFKQYDVIAEIVKDAKQVTKNLIYESVGHNRYDVRRFSLLSFALYTENDELLGFCLEKLSVTDLVANNQTLPATYHQSIISPLGFAMQFGNLKAAEKIIDRIKPPNMSHEEYKQSMLNAFLNLTLCNDPVVIDALWQKYSSLFTDAEKQQILDEAFKKDGVTFFELQLKNYTQPLDELLQQAMSNYTDKITAYLMQQSADTKDLTISRSIRQLMPNTFGELLAQKPTLIFSEKPSLIDQILRVYNDLKSHAYQNNRFERNYDQAKIDSKVNQMMIELLKAYKKAIKDPNVVEKEREQLFQAVISAMRLGWHKWAVEILSAVPSLYTQSFQGKSLAHIAAYYNATPVLEEIKKNYPQILTVKTEEHGNSPLFYACRGGMLGAVKYLCKNCPELLTITDKNGYGPLYAAIESRDTAIIMTVLRAGATLNKDAQLPDFSDSEEIRRIEPDAVTLLELQQYIQKREDEGINKLPKWLPFLSKVEQKIPKRGIPKEIKLGAAKFMKEYLLSDEDERRKLYQAHAGQIASYREALAEGRLAKFQKKYDYIFDPIIVDQYLPSNKTVGPG